MAPQLLFGNYRFDAEARELSRDGLAVELSAKAFDTLTILIDARPRAVPQHELYDALWPETAVEIANLHNVIHALRSALGDTSKTIIRTVYGYGFAFAVPVTEVARHPGTAARFELDVGSNSFAMPVGVHVIGRHFGSLVPITLRSVSRRHARIIVTETTATIEDLASTNGTFVGGERIASPVALRNGDHIVFGEVFTATFHVIAQPDSTVPAAAKKEFVRTS